VLVSVVASFWIAEIGRKNAIRETERFAQRGAIERDILVYQPWRHHCERDGALGILLLLLSRFATGE
jgi:hypothetical protein